MMTEPIRVLHVVGSLGIGGIQSYLMELYRHIDRNKVQFDFVVNIKTTQSYANEIKGLGGKVFYIDGDAFEKKQWRQYIQFWRLFFLYHSEYHIVHGHLRSTSVIYLREAKRAGCYTIAHSHATSNGYGKSARVKDILQWPVRYIADFCMGCSQQANEWMFGKKRAKGSTCIVLHNGIDVSKFRYSEDIRQEKRTELGISEEVFVIGCVGRLVEQKNQAVLIDAMPDIQKKMPNAILLIIGDGPMRMRLQNRVESLDIADDSVMFLGSRIDVHNLLSAMDIFVLPSKNEGLGIAVIEAQSNGLPVLISRAVPHEVCVTKLVSTVEKNDAESWAMVITGGKYYRDQIEAESIAGSCYDIVQVSNRLSDFYTTRSV